MRDKRARRFETRGDDRGHAVATDRYEAEEERLLRPVDCCGNRAAAGHADREVLPHPFDPLRRIPLRRDVAIERAVQQPFDDDLALRIGFVR